MTQQEIIDMAREAGLPQGVSDPDEWFVLTHELKRFADLVEAKAEAKEREACAELCETAPDGSLTQTESTTGTLLESPAA